MFLIVGKLDSTSSCGLVNGLLHRVCNLVGIHDDCAVEVTGGSTDSLGQRAVASEETFLVGIEYGHKGDFR